MTSSAEAYPVSILSSWLEIRVTLGEPSQYRHRFQPWTKFEQAYPRLKRVFDAMESTIQDISILQDVKVGTLTLLGQANLLTSHMAALGSPRGPFASRTRQPTSWTGEADGQRGHRRCYSDA